MPASEPSNERRRVSAVEVNEMVIHIDGQSRFMEPAGSLQVLELSCILPWPESCCSSGHGNR